MIADIETATPVANDASCSRHVVLLGDAPGELARRLREEPGAGESRPAAGRRGEWKLTLLPAGDLAGLPALRDLPDDGTHIVISIEGNRAIERSELLRGNPASCAEMLARLSLAADRFEALVRALVRASQAARLPTVICTMWLPRHPEPMRQRTAAAALAIFNDRIFRCAAEARLPVVDLRSVCAEADDYAGPALLSKVGQTKASNAVWRALCQVSRRSSGAELASPAALPD